LNPPIFQALLKLQLWVLGDKAPEKIRAIRKEPEGSLALQALIAVLRDGVEVSDRISTILIQPSRVGFAHRFVDSFSLKKKDTITRLPRNATRSYSLRCSPEFW
jgi:hypothetical protein